MAESASLKRLGGGRWQSRDGRFTVEPQSGTWVVVDGERTNELGLPLVRGPFPSLTAARADIEAARSEGPADSPLASRLAATPKRATGGSKRGGKAPRSETSPSEREGTPAAKTRARPEREPDEPAWLRSLDGSRRSAARRLISSLTEEGVEDAEGLVRSDLVGGQPALARLAISRRIADAVGKRRAPEAIAEAVAETLLDGQDRDLGVKWRLVDGDGRAIARLDPKFKGEKPR
jgi:hypothetical protein